MGIKVASYNLHGMNQGHSLLTNLCKTFDIIFVQEHWLYPDELSILEALNPDFMSVATSSMTDIGSRIRHERPHGGVGILIRKSLLHNLKCVAKRERFIAIVAGDIMFVNVYMPICIRTIEYGDSVNYLLSDIMSAIHENNIANVVLGGDFNFNFSHDKRSNELFHCLTDNNFITCDDLISLPTPPVTFRRNVDHLGTFIDHFCVTRDM